MFSSLISFGLLRLLSVFLGVFYLYFSELSSTKNVLTPTLFYKFCNAMLIRTIKIDYHRSY